MFNPCSQIHKVMAEADDNDDGVIQYEEFIPIMVDILQGLQVSVGDQGLSFVGLRCSVMFYVEAEEVWLGNELRVGLGSGSELGLVCFSTRKRIMPIQGGDPALPESEFWWLGC